MKHVHVVLPDLFLPLPLAQEVSAGLRLPTLEKLLVRSRAQALHTHTLEAWLCEAYAVPAVAPVTLLADGLQPEGAYWMRADPVHLRLNRDQMILQTNVAPSRDEAEQLCAHLNHYFAEMGMRFFAPHPQRWYVRLDADPGLQTHSVYQVEGRNSRFYLPQGAAALKWHGVLNEIQMALHGHAAYRASEARGVLPVNSLWLWGGGRAVDLAQPFDRVEGDCELTRAFAQAANIPPARVSDEKRGAENLLYVCEGPSAALRRGDYHAWRESVQKFEQEFMEPLLRSLVSGEIASITLDVPQEEGARRHELTRGRLWKVWIRPQALANHAFV